MTGPIDGPEPLPIPTIPTPDVDVDVDVDALEEEGLKKVWPPSAAPVGVRLERLLEGEARPY